MNERITIRLFVFIRFHSFSKGSPKVSNAVPDTQIRRRQDSNLRGQSPVDFASTPLTAWVRPHALREKLEHRVRAGFDVAPADSSTGFGGPRSGLEEYLRNVLERIIRFSWKNYLKIHYGNTSEIQSWCVLPRPKHTLFIWFSEGVWPGSFKHQAFWPWRNHPRSVGFGKSFQPPASWEYCLKII